MALQRRKVTALHDFACAHDSEPESVIVSVHCFENPIVRS
jgi:hypothetical protein